MSNLIRRGQTWFIRLHIPGARWADVGRAMGAPGGTRREVVRTLGTKDYREAQRRRDPALAGIRSEVDDALRRAGLKPLTDWTADWQARAVERREALREGVSRVAGTTTGIDPATGEDIEVEITEAELTRDTIAAEAEEIERRHGLSTARRFYDAATDTRMTIAEGLRLWLIEVIAHLGSGCSAVWDRR